MLILPGASKVISLFFKEKKDLVKKTKRLPLLLKIRNDVDKDRIKTELIKLRKDGSLYFLTNIFPSIAFSFVGEVSLVREEFMFDSYEPEQIELGKEDRRQMLSKSSE